MHAADLSRPALIARLREARIWDVVVIGGGASGLGCAVDAAARGPSVLLIEAQGFAAGTSFRATKLVPGGGGRLDGLVDPEDSAVLAYTQNITLKTGQSGSARVTDSFVKVDGKWLVKSEQQTMIKK